MTKFIRIISFILLFILLFTGTVFASDETTTLTVTADFSSVYKFVNIGEKPDISSATVTAVNTADNTEQVLTLDETYLPTDLDTSSVGRQIVNITAFLTKFSFPIIVLDKDTDTLKFEDFNNKYWGYSKIRHTLMAGFFKGKSDTLFGIKDNITRAEFCQMIFNIYKTDTDVLTLADEEITFTDVTEDKWYYEAVMACAKSGIVTGIGDGVFEPNLPISRQDAALIIMRILIGTEAIEQIDIELTLETARANGIAATDFDLTRDYAKKAVAAALGIIYYGDDNGNINPLNNITRTEAACMVSNLFFGDYIEEPTVVRHLIYISPENRDNSYSGVNTTEHEQMQIVAEKMKVILEKQGYDVFIADKATSIRENEDGISRAQEAKNMGASAYIALHSNAVGSTNTGKYQGCICFYNGNNEGAEDLSQKIYDNLSALTPTTDGGSRNDMLENIPFVEVRLPEMANVLIEVEYHDYEPYAKWIKDNTDAIAKSISDGIHAHFSSET